MPKINPASAHRTESQLASQDRMRVFAELEWLRFSLKKPAVEYVKSDMVITGGDQAEKSIRGKISMF